METFIKMVKENPRECIIIWLIGFVLGSLHHYFGL